ncbi:MAG: uridine kinase family protein [Christensenellales bacterium]
MRPALSARIQALMESLGRPALIAIDGPAGSGKSTLAEALRQSFPDSLLIHADDFFLQPHQRTQERLAEPGGNLDRERLLNQVLLPINLGSYTGHQRYNCHTGQMEQVPGVICPLIIIEGSYSHHPDLRGHYDLTVFLDIDSGTQLQRLRARCMDEAILKRFTDTWIPMENAYFERFKVRDQADVLFPCSSSNLGGKP